jgi:outer membrane protein
MLSLCALFVTAYAGFAQSKIGYADSQKILGSLKETQAVQAKLQQEQEKMYKQYQYLQDSLNTAQDDYVKNVKDNQLLKDNMKKSIQKGLEELAYLVQTSGQKYQEELVKKQQELMQPILEKVKKAIENVRKAEGLDYVLDTASGVLLSYDTKYDLTQKTIDELIKMGGATNESKDTGKDGGKESGKK